MDNESKFPEQKAPEKNDDNAYVQVGENGEPLMPSSEKKQTDIEKGDHFTTLDKR